MIELGHKILGTGKTKIVILHELMGDHNNYEAILPYLDKANFTYIFVDLRGYGLSKNICGEYSCEEAANDVKNLIAILKLDTVNLLAHSMSTMIAQKVALIDESHISQLILVKSSQEKLLSDLRHNDGNIEEIVKSASKRHNESWRKNRIDMAYNASVLDARVGYMKMYLTTNFLDEVPNIKAPIKIIVGKYDFPIFSFKTVSS